MPNEDFFYNYFINPIISKTGYNAINTATYAIIAIATLYIIWNIFKSRKVQITEGFVYSVMTFVLFGSTMRVVTDAIDNGVFKPITPIHEIILNSHLYDYGYLTVTPGVYLVTAAILFAAMGILNLLGKQRYLFHTGMALWVFHLALLLPFMRYFLDAIPVALLALVPYLISKKYLRNKIYPLVVAGHALDGAATFWVIDVFGPRIGKDYFEQHVFGAAIGKAFGTFFVFYLVKVAISAAVGYMLEKEKEDGNFKNFIALAIMIAGFAPGIRDLLRMVVGA